MLVFNKNTITLVINDADNKKESVALANNNNNRDKYLGSVAKMKKLNLATSYIHKDAVDSYEKVWRDILPGMNDIPIKCNNINEFYSKKNLIMIKEIYKQKQNRLTEGETRFDMCYSKYYPFTTNTREQQKLKRLDLRYRGRLYQNVLKCPVNSDNSAYNDFFKLVRAEELSKNKVYYNAFTGDIISVSPDQLKIKRIEYLTNEIKDENKFFNALNFKHWTLETHVSPNAPLLLLWDKNKFSKLDEIELIVSPMVNTNYGWMLEDVFNTVKSETCYLVD